MSDDWEYSDKDCPKCSSQLAERRCGSCGGEGYIEDEDDIGSTFTERCDNCDGKRFEVWCRECGWDVNFNCFLSPEYERAYLERQAAEFIGKRVEDEKHGRGTIVDTSAQNVTVALDSGNLLVVGKAALEAVSADAPPAERSEAQG